MIKDKITCKGVVTIVARNKRGKIVWKKTINNLVVDHGRTSVCHLLSGDVANRSIINFGYGTSDTAPTTADNALTAPYTNAVVSFAYPSATSLQVNGFLDYTEDNGAIIQELALISNDGNLYSRIVWPPIVKTSGIALTITWLLTF